MARMWLGFGLVCAVAAISTHEQIRRVPRPDTPQSLLEAELDSEAPKPVAMAESLIALAMADADAGSVVGNQALGSELQRKAQSAMQEMRTRVESNRRKMWKSLREAYHAVENCVMDKEPKIASLLADADDKMEDSAVEAAQNEMQMMADLDKMASDHRSCRMEEDSARAATIGCQAAHGGTVCTPVNDAHQTQKKICDDAQVLLEQKACRVVSKGRVCDERMKCHAEQTKAYEEAREAAQQHEEELRREEHALIQIECILTTGPGSFSSCKDLLRTPRSMIVSASGSLVEDPSAMLVQFPKPPAAKACLASDEAKSLLTSFFFGLPQGAPALACSSDCCTEDDGLMDVAEEKAERDFHWRFPSGILAGVPIYSQSPRMHFSLSQEVEMPAQETLRTVSVNFVVAGLDYSKLMGNHEVLEQFRNATKAALRELTASRTSDVKLVVRPSKEGTALSASVVSSSDDVVKLTPKAMRTHTAFVGLAKRIKAVSGIRAATKGDIQITVGDVSSNTLNQPASSADAPPAPCPAPKAAAAVVTPPAPAPCPGPKAAAAEPAPAPCPGPKAAAAKVTTTGPAPCPGPKAAAAEVTTTGPAPCPGPKVAAATVTTTTVAPCPKEAPILRAETTTSTTSPAPCGEVSTSFPVHIVGSDHPCSDLRGRFEWIIKFPDGTADSLLQEVGEQFPSKDQYRGHPGEKGLPMVIAWATQDELALALHNVPGASYVEQVSDLDASEEIVDSDVGNSSVPWGLDRIDSEGEIDGRYLAAGPDGGRGIHVYILDSGIRSTHGQMGGRAIPTLEALSSKPRACSSTDVACATDKFGHGTHAAATIGGSTVGVAQGAWLHAVKILNDRGRGNTANFMIAMDWLLVNAEKPAVIHLGLHGSTSVQESRAVKDAIDAAYNAGLTVVAAGGDDNKNACFDTPGYVPNAITVGGIRQVDEMVTSSNHGPCVDLFAPGSKIKTADYKSDSGYSLVTGSSMAAAHATGAAALALGVWSGLTTREVRDQLVDNAFPNALEGIKEGSPNKLLSVTFVLNVVPIIIGPSTFATSWELEANSLTKYRKKCVCVSKEVTCPTNAGDFGQRLGFDDFRGTFNITVEGDSVCAERTDNIQDDFLPNDKFTVSKNDAGSWTLNLAILCNLKDFIPPTDKWAFGRFGERDRAPVMCSGKFPADRQSLYYAAFSDAKAVNSTENCEKFCQSRYGCKGYSLDPGRSCEVWLHDIESFVRPPSDYQAAGTMKCMRFAGRGNPGSGLIRAAGAPKTCLVSESNALHIADCEKSSTSQQMVWAGVGSMAVQNTSCFTVYKSGPSYDGAGIGVGTCTSGEPTQQFAFEGSGTIRFVGDTPREWCLLMDLEKNASSVKVAKCDNAHPSMQFFF